MLFGLWAPSGPTATTGHQWPDNSTERDEGRTREIDRSHRNAVPPNPAPRKGARWAIGSGDSRGINEVGSQPVVLKTARAFARPVGGVIELVGPLSRPVAGRCAIEQSRAPPGESPGRAAGAGSASQPGRKHQASGPKRGCAGRCGAVCGGAATRDNVPCVGAIDHGRPRSLPCRCFMSVLLNSPGSAGRLVVELPQEKRRIPLWRDHRRSAGRRRSSRGSRFASMQVRVRRLRRRRVWASCVAAGPSRAALAQAGCLQSGLVSRCGASRGSVLARSGRWPSANRAELVGIGPGERAVHKRDVPAVRVAQRPYQPEAGSRTGKAWTWPLWISSSVSLFG